MKKNLFKILYVFVLLLGFSSSVFANEIFSQSNSTTESSSFHPSTPQQYIEPYLSSVLGSIQVYSRITTGSSTLTIEVVDTFGGSTDVACATSPQTLSTSKSIYAFDLYLYDGDCNSDNSLLVFDPTHRYKIKYLFSDTTNARVYGCSSDCLLGSNNYATSASPLQDIFFILYDNESIPITNPFFNSVVVDSPNVNDNYPSPYIVNFSGSYYYADGLVPEDYDSVRYDVVRLDNLSVVSSVDTIVSNVLTSFDFDLTLSADSNYSFVVAFYNSIDSTILEFSSSQVFFTTGDASGLVGGATPLSPCSIIRIDNCLANFFTWLFVPSPASLQSFSSLTLSDRFPISYLYDASSLISTLFSNPAGMDFDISIPFGGFGTIQLISVAQIEAVPFVATFRTIFGFLILLLTAFTIYKIVLRIFR